MKDFRKGQLVLFRFRNAVNTGTFLGYSGGSSCRIEPTDLAFRTKIEAEFGRGYLFLFSTHVKHLHAELGKNNPNVTFRLTNQKAKAC